MNERGAITFGPIVGVIVILLALIGVFAVCSGDNDYNSLGRMQLVSHEYDGGDQDYEQNYGSEDDRNRNRGRDRGAFSPGPFRDSPVDAFNNVCMPGATCTYNPPPEREQPS